MERSVDIRGGAAGRWRRWGGYALGIIIESLGVAVIALLALGLMFLIKVIMT
jgi:hypothetical protein